MTLRSSSRFGFVALLVSLAMVAMIVTGCGQKDSASGAGGTTTGVTDTSVLIGSHQPLTGVAAAGYSEMAPAMDAYFQFVNDNGGIHGRSIDFRYLDDMYDPTKAVQIVRKLVLEDQVFCIFSGFGTSTHLQVAEFLASRQVPDVFPVSGAPDFGKGETFSYTWAWEPSDANEGQILGEYVAANFSDKKIGFFYQNDTLGQSGVGGLEKSIPDSQVVAKEPFEPGADDLGPQASALKRAGAEVVCVYAVTSYTARFRLACLKIGYEPQFVISSVGSDPVTLSGLLSKYGEEAGVSGAGSSLIEGVITTNYVPDSGDAGNSWIQLFQRIHDKYVPDLPFDFYVVYGMASAFDFSQILQEAGPDLTREGLIQAIQKGGYQGASQVPLSYSATSHVGMRGTQMGIIKGQSIQVLGDRLIVDESGQVVPFTEPLPQAPSDGLPVK